MSDRPDARHDGDHYMFVVRVLLGQPYVARKPHKYQRPPCTAQCDDTCTHSDFYDSVIGTHKDMAKSGGYVMVGGHPASAGPGTRPLLFREFVIFDKSQCYPEFLVTYERR